MRRVKNEVPAVNPTDMHFDILPSLSHLVLHDTGSRDTARIITLGHPDLLPALKNELLFGDGTFSVVPSLFYQLYTVHAKVGTSYPPAIYFLLPNKQQRTYTKMLKILKELVPECDPKSFLLDYEKAMINSVKATFPNCEVNGCFFHLCQCVIRHVSAVGLKKEYESNIDFSILVKSLMSLAFVPCADVTTVFDQLCAKFPDTDACDRLLDYFKQTFIQQEARNGRPKDPLYKIELWNHFEDGLNCVPKTTNCTGMLKMMKFRQY